VIRLTRRYKMPAAHVLSNPKLSHQENDEIFGKCANPNGHGHNYEFEISVTGPIDETTGQIIPRELLDEIFDETIGRRYSYKLLNDCEGFAELVPTSENFAEVVFRDLEPVVARRTAGKLLGVRLTETPRNFFEYGEFG
jgi:6-pyruvoyltetrahydropterin/6-carboxytetrahydropterin synthase